MAPGARAAQGKEKGKMKREGLLGNILMCMRYCTGQGGLFM